MHEVEEILKEGLLNKGASVRLLSAGEERDSTLTLSCSVDLLSGSIRNSNPQ